MKLKEKEFKVFYEGEFNEELDNAIEEALKPFGYKRWASGMDLVDNVRDLVFDKEA